MSPRRLFKFGVGGIFFLLPLFFLLPPIANTIEAQLTASKFLVCFFLGAIALSTLVYLCGQSYLAIVNLLLSLSVFLVGMRATAMAPYVYWVAALATALFFVRADDDSQEFFFKAVVYAAVVSSVLGFFQSMDLDPILSYANTITEADRRLPIGLLGQATKHGAFLAIALGMALGLRQWVAAAFILAGVILTNSSFTWLAAGGAILVWARHEWGWRMALRLVCAGLGFVLGVYLLRSEHTMDNGRFAIWEATLSAWWNGPRYLGFGLGSFSAPTGPGQTLFAQFFQPKYLREYGSFMQAHNDYLQLIFEMGFLGIMGIVSGIYFLGRYYLVSLLSGEKNRVVIVAAECGLMAILLNAIGNFPFQLAPHYLLAVIFVALLLEKSGYNKL